MADFSSFGEQTDEWLNWVKDHGIPAPTPLGQKSAEELQRATNEWRDKTSAAAMIQEGLSDRISIKTVSIPASDGYSIPTRLYTPRTQASKPESERSALLPVYLYYHGGGFLYGTLSSEDVACSRIADALSIIVVNVCYRHTPQDTYPAQHNDAFDSFDWVLLNMNLFGGDPQKLVVGGISAGANLAAAIVLRENLKVNAQNTESGKNNKLSSIKGQVLVIPWLIIRGERFPYELMASREKSSRIQCADVPVLPKPVLNFFVDALKLEEHIESTDKFLDVGLAMDKDIVGFPRTAFMIAGRDPLRDEGLLYAKKLHQNKVATKVDVFPGVPHGFRRFADLPSSRRHDELLIENIRWVLGSETTEFGTDMKMNVVSPLDK